MKKATGKKRITLMIGYLLIIIGISLPLASLTSMSWRQLQAEMKFKHYVEASSSAEVDPLIERRIEEYNQMIQTGPIDYVDPFRMRDYKTDYNISDDPDAIFAYIHAPKLDLYQPIRLGADQDHLAIGAAHVDGTALPVGGKSNRSVIAGHRSTQRETFFYNIDELEPGDRVYIYRQRTKLTYLVTGQEEVDYTDWSKLDPVEGEDLLTLLTCIPFGLAPERRLLVHARRLDTEVATDNNNTVEPSEIFETSDIQGMTDPIQAEPTVDEAKQEVASSVKLLNNAIYAATLIGYTLIIAIIVKAIRN